MVVQSDKLDHIFPCTNGKATRLGRPKFPNNSLTSMVFIQRHTQVPQFLEGLYISFALYHI